MNKIITDGRVFTEEYVPKRLAHRMDRVSTIADNLRPILENQPPVNTLLYGPPGTGKTVLSKFVAEELRKEAPEVSYVRINGFKQPNRFEIFYKAVDSVKNFVNRDSYSTEQLVEEFEQIARKRPFIFIIDELDQFTDTSTLYDLARFRTSGIIFVSNSSTAIEDLSDPLKSRFSGIQKVEFATYSNSQIVDILDDRAEKGLVDSSYDQKHLESIARNAKGDARIAIRSLLKACQRAEKEGKSKLEDDIIENSFGDTISERRTEVLEKLNEDQLALYEALKDEGEMKASTLKQKYRTEVDNPKSDRQVRRYLSKMANYDIVRASGRGKGRKYSLK